MKKSYRLLLTTPWHIISLIAALTIVMFFLIFLITKIWVVIVYAIALMPLHSLLLRHLATAELETTVDETGLRMQLIKPLWFRKERWEHSFTWKEIADYKSKRDRNYRWLVLRLENGRKKRFYRYDNYLFIRTRDDYDAFLTDFIESFKKHHA